MKAPGRIHDLTALLQTHMPVWPTMALPVFEPVGLIPRDGYSVERINCSTHTGTHMDAPYHFLEDGATIDQIPPSDLIGRAALLDLRTELDGNLIRRSVVERHWPKGRSPEIVLLETGWSHHRAPTKRYLYDFPGLELPAAEWLAQKSIKGVGTDALGIDPFSNAQFEAHKVLLRRGIWILEALDHLDELSEGTEYTLVAGPLKIEHASGAMCRVFAME